SAWVASACSGDAGSARFAQIRSDSLSSVSRFVSRLLSQRTMRESVGRGSLNQEVVVLLDEVRDRNASLSGDLRRMKHQFRIPQTRSKAPASRSCCRIQNESLPKLSPQEVPSSSSSLSCRSSCHSAAPASTSSRRGSLCWSLTSTFIPDE